MSLLGPAQASIITINFDGPGLTNFVQLNSQYPSVTFSTVAGEAVMIDAQNPPYQGSVPNLICTGTPAGGQTPAVMDCTHDITLTFTNPVDNLSFGAYGNSTLAGTAFGSVDVFFGSGPSINVPMLVTHTTKCDPQLFPTAPDCVADPQSLLYTGITKIVLHTSDPAGTAYDDFTFSPEDAVVIPTGPVPEPSTLMLTGLCGIFWTGRRLAARKNRNNT